MSFVFDTMYDPKAVTAMARGLRKTIRKKPSKRLHIFGCGVILLILLLTFPLDGGPFDVNGRTVIIWGAGAMILVALLLEDALNAWFARRRMLTGTERATSLFTPEGFSSETAVGETQWQYDAIRCIAESKDYFVFVLDQRYAQVYNKRTMTGGSMAAFRTFPEEKTGKKIQNI